MSSALDQIFVHGKRWLLSWFAGAPNWVIQITSSLINIVALLAVFLTLFALMSVLERKILARMQNRYGPNRVGPFGLFQPIADGIKMLIKEDIVPARADKVVHFLAPVILAAVAILTLGVIPYGRNMTAFTIDGGILFFFAVGSATELAVFMAGWASNNKFSMLGAMRAIAQMFSYELPLIITVLPVVMVVGSLMPDRIVFAQGEYTLGIVPRWFVFTPWGAAAFILFFVSGLVESNRTPFDVPEGESEIVAGHMTEYSGFKYATFFMAEYLGMFAVSGLAVTLFLGGWHAPVRVLEFVPSYVWFFAKAERAAFRLYLAPRHAPAHARGSNDECRLEVHVADGVHVCHRRRRLALCRARAARMAVVAVRDRGCLQRAIDLARHAKEIRAACLPFR